ncbi:MAG TPA: D-aminoacylase [Cellvibrionaceae bacterium]
MSFDTVIRGAHLADGSGNRLFKADVAITNGRISWISDNISEPADHVVDAHGLVLAPGFIDVHTHDDLNVVSSPGMLTKISQGVTTVIVGNCGISASPVRLTSAPPDPLNLLGKQQDFTYPRFSDYARAVSTAKPSVNVAALVGHTAIRNNHMKNLRRAATEQELNAMRQDLCQALAEGALGLSSGLAYSSAQCAPSEEVLALVKEVGKAGGIYTTHLRTEFEAITEAMGEAFSTAKSGEVPLIISHLKCAGRGNWGRSSNILSLLDTAAKTQQVACDCYPYAASSSTLDLAQVTDETDIFITWSESHPEQAGKLLKDIASQWQLDLLEAAKLLQPAGAVYHCMSEDDVSAILRHPLSMVGSDGLPNDPHPHPRLWGTFPRVLGHYCRDLKLFDLPAAIHKMTGLSAQQFRLEKRGLIREGYHADLTLFDFATIKDTASYADPQQAAQGIAGVWVNGVASYPHTSSAPGRAGQFLYRNKP